MTRTRSIGLLAALCPLVSLLWPVAAAVGQPPEPEDPMAAAGRATGVVVPFEAASTTPGQTRSGVRWRQGRPQWYTSTDLSAETPPPGVPFVPTVAGLSHYWSAGWNAWGSGSVGTGAQVAPAADIGQLGMSQGFPLNLDLLSSPAPGDFLPRSPTVGGDSVCLLPAGAGDLPTGWQGANRPTLHGLVDLVTGVPLIQVTDLELPMDGAMFRLIRTRSGHHASAAVGRGARVNGADRWWDWTGQGWMISENPILLIDASLADVTGDGPRTTWLWLDAHHSIPFQRVYHPAATPGQARMTYEAPPRFRARMTHNGVWTGPTAAPPAGVHLEEEEFGRWAVPPTQYDVWLYDGLLHYTFVVVREDTPFHMWDPSVLGLPSPGLRPFSFHSQPITRNVFIAADPQGELAGSHSPSSDARNPGFGVPFYGLCVRVQDQNHHTVEVNYADSPRYAIKNPASSPDCRETLQDTLSRGEIRWIKLKTRETVNWTLVYAHRRYRGLRLDTGVGKPFEYLTAQFPVGSNQQLYEVHGHTMIDRIYAYQGDIPDALLERADLTIHHLDDTPALDWSGREPLAHYNAQPANSAFRLPANWTHQVRYHYDVPQSSAERTSPPLLMKTSIRTRSSVPDASASANTGTPSPDEIVRRRIYVSKIDSVEERHRHYSSGDIPWLWMIFEDEDIARAKAMRPDLNLTDANIATWRLPHRLLPSEELPYDSEYALLGAASVRVWPFRDAGSDHYVGATGASPPASALLAGGFLPASACEAFSDNAYGRSVGLAVVGSAAGGSQRVYQLNRLVVPQDPARPSTTDPCPLQVGGSGSAAERRYGRSVVAHPFPWRSTVVDASADTNTSLAEAPDLSSPRWLVLIDELPSTYAAAGGSRESYDSLTGLKPGQLGRRFVAMNASGFVLRERTWAFDGSSGAAAVTGHGLGSESIYERVGALFEGQDLPDSLAQEVVMTAHKTIGWSAAAASNAGASDGLVHFFEHRLVPDEFAIGGKRVEQWGSGIRKGDQGQRLYSGKQFNWLAYTPNDSAGQGGSNIEYTTNVTYLVPPTDFEGATFPSIPDLASLRQHAVLGNQVSVAITIRSADPEASPPQDGTPPEPPRAKRVLSAVSIGAPRRVHPGSQWYFPVERQWFNDLGQPTWSCAGLLRDPFQPPAQADPFERLVFTYTQYSDAPSSYGQPAHHVVDASPSNGAGYSTASGNTAVVPAWPVDEAGRTWVRVGPSPAINSITSYLYDQMGLSDTFHPTGLRSARRFVIVNKPPGDEANHWMGDCEHCPDTGVVREYQFKDLDLVSGQSPGGNWRALSPGRIVEYDKPSPSGRPYFTINVEFTDESFDLNLASGTRPAFQKLKAVRLGLDGAGKVQKADSLEWVPGFGWMAEGTKIINDLGEVRRVLELDGSITRTTRNLLGQELRTYKGTDDIGWPADADGDRSGDMVLVERTEYGLGSHDAWLPTVNRRYVDKPSWSVDRYGTPPDPDLDGIATVTGYDWRMRPVKVRSFPRGDYRTLAPLSTSVTYLDHFNRPVLEVTFGAGEVALGDQDPVNLGPLAGPPSVAALLALSPRPTAINQTIYEPDGEIAERREYDLSPGGGSVPAYLAHYQYRGHLSKEVFTQAPGQAATLSSIDALGRTLSTRTIAPGVGSGAYTYELARTDNTFDRFGNIVEASTWERVPGKAGDVLGETNAVRTRSVTWYDVKNRAIAQCDLGTESQEAGPGGYAYSPKQFMRFSPGPTPLDDWHAPAPTLEVAGGVATITRPAGLPPTAPLMIHTFDRNGREIYTANPNGSVTETRYTTSGRPMAKIENAFGPLSDRRRTEFTHALGRLTEITAWPNAAVPSAYQKSAVAYQAEVVDDDFAVVSHTRTQVGRMSLPLRDSGGAGLVADIGVRYNLSGQIAERSDPRGVVFRYRYDDLNRLASVEVVHPSGSDTAPSMTPGYPALVPPAAAVPDGRMGFVAYNYDSDNRLSDIKAYSSRDFDATAPPLSHVRQLYDANGRLTLQLQLLGRDIRTDLNGDNVVDPEDLSDFIACIFADDPCPAADFNVDGFVDPDDLQDFIAAFWAPANQGPLPFIAYVWAQENSNPSSPAAIGGSRLEGMVYPSVQGADQRLLKFRYGDGASSEFFAGPVDSMLSRITAIESGSESAGGRLATFEYAGVSRRSALALGPTTGFSITQRLRGTSGVALSGLDRYGRLADLHYRNAAGQTLYQAQYSYDAAGNRLTADILQSDLGLQGPFTQSNLYDLLDRLTATSIHAPATSGVPTLVRRDTWGLDALGNWVGGPAGTVDPATGLPRPGRRTEQPLLGAAGTIALTHAVNGRNELTGITVNGAAAPAPRHDAAGNQTFDGDYFYQYDAWNRLLQVNRAHESAGPGSPLVLGALVKHYTYDGLGRQIQIVSPFAPSGGPRRVERLYYDGIRRVQEVVGDSDSAGVVSSWSLAREYVWGPGDGPSGVDELLAQFDGPSGLSKPWWILQDGGGDVVAQCETTAAGATRVVGQWTYHPYGSVATAETLETSAAPGSPRPPPPHLGHKGLFLDRLDEDLEGPTGPSGPKPPRLTPGAKLLVQMRNRAYLPDQGRFLQADPNASAMLTIATGAHSGDPLGVDPDGIDGIDLAGRYGDGACLYEYVRSRPGSGSDPLGLFYGAYALRAGSRLGNIGYELTAQYASNQEMDLDWASDWSQRDDMNSRMSSGWVDNIFQDAFSDFAKDAAMDMLGPLGDIMALFELGTAIGEYLVGDDGSSGPTMAGIPARKLFARTIKHGNDLHRNIMRRGIGELRGMGAKYRNMRLNQALVDPTKNVKLSTMRPDVQAFVSPNKLYIFEACFNQSKAAAQRKWKEAEEKLRGMGYQVTVILKARQDYGL